MIGIQEIIIEIIALRQEANGDIADIQRMKLSCNSWKAGFDSGIQYACQELLNLIEGKERNEN